MPPTDHDDDDDDDDDDDEHEIHRQEKCYHRYSDNVDEESDVDDFDEGSHHSSFEDDCEELYDEEFDEDYCEEDDGDSVREIDSEPSKPFAEPRLDSFDSYIVVSVLTATASFAALLDDNPEGAKSLTQKPLARNVAILICAICSLSGIYSTVVFSFSSIYGRTAIGMGNHRACESFLEATASTRKKAFYSYLTSLVLFIVLLIIAAMDKIDPQLEAPLGVVLVGVSALVYRDWGHIVRAAGVIFVPPPGNETPGGVRKHGMKLRSRSSHHDRKDSHGIEVGSLSRSKCKHS